MFIEKFKMIRYFQLSFLFYFIFKLYIIVLVLPKKFLNSETQTIL